MPYKDPEKQRAYMQNHRKTHLDKYRKYTRRYYRKHRHERRQKEREQILFCRRAKGQLGRMRMLFDLGGCCIFCSETDPLKLEIHHPFGRKKQPNVMIQVCTDCHMGRQKLAKLKTEYQK